MTEAYPEVANVLASWSEEDKHVALLRLAAQYNNGTEHFDHGPEGYSWLCLACTRDRDGSLKRLALLSDLLFEK